MVKNKNIIFATQCVLLFLIICVAYLISRVLVIESNVTIQIGMAILLFASFLPYFISKKRGDTEANTILCRSIILAGIIMRIGYMLYTPCNVRSHDLWDFTSDSGGHAGYILTLIETGDLPQSNYLQYYQQPFYYIISSIVSKGLNAILQSSEPFFLVDAAKTVSCFASCMVLILSKKLCNISGLKKSGTVIALTLVAFMPSFYLVGGRVNCDALVALFLTLELIYTIKWYKSPSWSNTAILALTYGLGVITKISSAVLSLFTIAVFIYKLYQANNKKTTWTLISKYIIFGIISLPIGLWYGLRNYKKFGQPLTYVLELPKDSEYYFGDYSIFSRLFNIDFKNLFSTPYAIPFSDYNAPVYYLKSSLFGEFQYVIPGWIPTLLLVFAVLLAFVSVLALIWHIFKNTKDKACLAMIFTSLLIYISALYFYQSYTFGCSMDFRYFVFITVPISILLGKFFEANSVFIIGKITKVTLPIFGILSCVMYIMIQ